MRILVSAYMKIAELVKQFNEEYPFLRLEVYHKGEEMGDAPSCTLNEIAHRKILNSFVIMSEMKVFEIEELFWENMGLQVSVFRKSGKTWLESSFTNYWSLERQNNLGREMNSFMNIETKRVTL
ncbi:hypothetical protein [Emticicia sp.]|uniref:hypothetical protein n=1 Tax=Emticicia sp. TaxID=1930953 RepID=UPI003750A0C0